MNALQPPLRSLSIRIATSADRAAFPRWPLAIVGVINVAIGLLTIRTNQSAIEVLWHGGPSLFVGLWLTAVSFVRFKKSGK
jgi:hypothetical protein